MEHIWNLDPYVAAGLAITLALIACVAIWAAMRDQRSTADKLVTRSVRCPQRQESAVATFVEHARMGRVTRSLQSCSLLDVGEHCSESCAHEFVREVSRPAATGSVDSFPRSVWLRRSPAPASRRTLEGSCRKLNPNEV